MNRSGFVGKACVALGMLLVTLAVATVVDRAEGGCAFVYGSQDCADQPIVLCGNAYCEPSLLEGPCVCDLVPIPLGCGCVAE
jgi:hypothetical protein